MSTIPETDLDLEKLFLPAWAQESSTLNRYADFSGEDRPERSREGRRDGRRGGPGPRREGFRGPAPSQSREAGPRRPRREGDKPGRRDEHRGDRRDRVERHEPPPPPVEVQAALMPDEHGVDSLARQIKTTGRAYPLFGIAQLILQKPDRYGIRFTVKKNPEGQIIQPLFVCALDDTLWLSEDEAVSHVLRNHFATFYQAERTATEPPKGTYTFVAQCGMSGIILGPPNHHDYQNQLRKLHAEKFGRMPFDTFKARVKIVRDEEVVKKWVEEQSWKTEYLCLNVPEPLKLNSMEEVEKHFRSVHKENIIKPVEKHTLTGVAARSMRSPGLGRLARLICEDQRRFPLQMATNLSQQFASRGLQFFKVNKTVTHVSVARPHFLDLETTPVSDGVKRIVEFINANPKCTRRKLLEAIAPAPAAPPSAPSTESAQSPAEGSSAPASADSPSAPVAPAALEPTAEQTAVIADLHWLIHQGHVIEFASGQMETAKKPLPKPPKPEPKATAEGTVQQTQAPESHATPTAPEASSQPTPATEASPETTDKSEGESHSTTPTVPPPAEPTA